VDDLHSRPTCRRRRHIARISCIVTSFVSLPARMRRQVTVIALAAVLPLGLAGPGAAARPLETAVWEERGEPSSARIAAAGADVVHMTLNWSSVAPATRPPGFNAADPEDPAYQWSDFDSRLTRVTRHGLRPLVAVYRAPSWAQGQGQGPAGTVRPDPRQVGAFARAAALRYSGSFQGLPRVRNWQLWLEQNLHFHFNPQFERGRLISPIWYRSMLNAFADAVHAVHRDNVVITGGLAPFTTPTGVGPLPFMRVMLCMSKKLKPTCRSRSRFDVWAHHPYTSGGPNHHANLHEDVSLGDLPQMRRLLDAAVRAGHVESRQAVRFWVTEFGWDTSPPDPKGVPSRLHARWVAEALYRMWSVGISLVTWNQLRDQPFPGSPFQSGLYFRGRTIKRDRPKPALRAFRFPFVALPEKGRVVTWGRTPNSTGARVVLERSFGRGWGRLAALQADRHGIFKRTWKMRPGGYMRARLPTGELSLPFAVKKTRDRRVCVFGTLPNCSA
jgi:hypothetical protein